MKKNYQIPTISIIRTEAYELLAGSGVNPGNIVANTDGGVNYGGGGNEMPRAHQAFDFFEEDAFETDESTSLKINLDIENIQE